MFSLFHFKNLWIVDAGNKVDSVNLLLALPVGAKSANFLDVSSYDNLFMFLYRLTIPFIKVVFPVPGPPVITKKFF